MIASLVGTKTVIDPKDAAMIEGFLVNKMRGDPSLFDDGMRTIAEMTGWQDLGLIPYFDATNRLPAEDAFELADRAEGLRSNGRVRIVVPMLPRIANFDDFDPLANEPDVELIFVAPGEPLPAPCDLVILPGSKATIADLAAFRDNGWHIDLAAHSRRGGRILGICGGLQMLGKSIADPDGMEGPPQTVEGLGLLDIETVLTGDKSLTAVSGQSISGGYPFTGYEMHIGRTTGPDTDRPLLRLDSDHTDGAVSTDGLVAGTYVHGLFGTTDQRAAWISELGGSSTRQDYGVVVEETLDALAAHLEAHVDIDRLTTIAR